ncbi:hypothetical protein MKEN_00547600 [Mycena kentingensis (nom. inval.)]|nr:hypothetical protein MKEN_00547600 [Mycena kentingensis (nom. inval.)]
MSADNIPNAHPRRVLVVGGGASGLVTLRNLLDRGEFDDVQLVERRQDLGGVWKLDEENGKWASPAYRGLIGNVLPEFLSFSAHEPFPEPPNTAQGQPFPSLSETHAYLRGFAAPLVAAGKIRLNMEVVAVDEFEGHAGWSVRMRDWARGGELLEEAWDAVVIAVCAYDHAAYPETPGVEELRRTPLASHCKTWRGPEGYENKRVLVVGNANSGNDIAAQLAPVARAVFQSIRRPNWPGFPSLPDERIERVKPVAAYTIHSGTATACLIDGTVIPALDAVIFATGYYPHPDFVRVRGEDGQLRCFVKPEDRHVPDLHRYTLYVRNPSLAFVGTAIASYTPFTIADVCSTWLALAWSSGGGVTYPTTVAELLVFERDRMAAVAAGRAEMAATTECGEASSLASYGVLGPFEEEFAAGLRKEIVEARPELDGVLSRWNPERTEAREAMFPVKKRALELARDGAF